MERNSDGNGTCVFQDTNTGYMSEIPVTVYQGHQYSYTVNTVPVQYIEKNMLPIFII